MSTKTYPVAEARRLLSALIEHAASGRGPVYIGRRGRAEVALVPVHERAEAPLRSLQGLCTLVEGDLAQPDMELAAAFEVSLAATEGMVVADSRRVRPRRTRRRRTAR